MLQMRLNEIADLYERVQSLMHNCPDVLKLDVDSDSKSVTSVQSHSAKKMELIGQEYIGRLGRTCFCGYSEFVL